MKPKDSHYSLLCAIELLQNQEWQHAPGATKATEAEKNLISPAYYLKTSEKKLLCDLSWFANHVFLFN